MEGNLGVDLAEMRSYLFLKPKENLSPSYVLLLIIIIDNNYIDGWFVF